MTSSAPVETPSWTGSRWVKWSWLILLVAIIAQSLNYHWRVLPTSAAGYFARGKGDYLNDEFESAAANFTKSLELRPDDADSLLWRGEAYVKLHELPRAMEDLEKAVALRPEYSQARAALADGKAAAWDTIGAIAEYSRAIDADANFARCYVARGRLRLEAGQVDDAVADLRIASRLLVEDKQGPADLLLWIARARRGDVAGATADLSRALRVGRPSGERFRTSARFLCGEIDESAYLSAMAALVGAEGIGTRAEAFFLVGTKRLLAGDRSGGMEWMRKTLETRAEPSYAIDGARYELERSRLGFHAMWLPEVQRRELWLPPYAGLEIATVVAGGTETHGIRPGEVVATIDGASADQATYLAFLWRSAPGAMAELELIEDAATRERVPLTLRLDASAPTR